MWKIWRQRDSENDEIVNELGVSERNSVKSQRQKEPENKEITKRCVELEKSTKSRRHDEERGFFTEGSD